MFFLCSSCIVDSIHDVMLVLVLLLLGARQLKVENFIFLSNKKLPCQPTYYYILMKIKPRKSREMGHMRVRGTDIFQNYNGH